jgi:hypothetical protein
LPLWAVLTVACFVGVAALKHESEVFEAIPSCHVGAWTPANGDGCTTRQVLVESSAHHWSRRGGYRVVFDLQASDGQRYSGVTLSPLTIFDTNTYYFNVHVQPGTMLRTILHRGSVVAIVDHDRYLATWANPTMRYHRYSKALIPTLFGSMILLLGSVWCRFRLSAREEHAR